MIRACVACVLLSACTITPGPAPPTPPAADGNCEDVETNLRKLGGCGYDVDRFVQDCRDTKRARADSKASPLPYECMSTAESCPEAETCR